MRRTEALVLGVFGRHDGPELPPTVDSVQVGLLAEQPSVRLLKHIVRCYLRLSDNPRAREALRQCLPDLLRSPQFTACLKDDPTTCRHDALS